ncbi:MAG: trypsin-like peptidase domain-containing protein [Burkholderiales bacterium]|nr:trypsin-like peptidase domain-containing protein [Burkholderiales bacterium]
MKFRLSATTAMFCVAAAIAASGAGSALAADAVARDAAAGVVTSVPPVEFRRPAISRNAARLTSTAALARRIELAAPDAAETAPMQLYNAALLRGEGKGQPLAIGFGRELPTADRVIALSALTWIASADGGRTARVDIVSPGAAALRVAVELSDPTSALSLRFAGSAADTEVFDARSPRHIGRVAGAGGRFWSPVLAGDVAIIEVHVAAGATVDGASLRISRISHLLAAGRDLHSLPGVIRKVSGIGAAGTCNIDSACVFPANPAARDLAKSVARLSFVGDSGGSYICTGTLLGDSVQSFTPYLLSANHCLDSANVAATLNTFWFFAADACNSKQTPPFVQLTGGAQLLGRSPDHDWSIVRLLDVPPAGAIFAAWRAEPIADTTSVATLHHPEGDLLKWSKGQTTGSLPIDDFYVYDIFTEVVWNEGVTEAGSSGGALLTLAPGGSHYEVRGALYAGISSCAQPHSPDYYSRLETALPVMRSYLTPNAANPDGLVAATEFYNQALDHYFLSTNPVEIDNLDSGRTRGWQRTGLRFIVHERPTPGTGPVCRFYRAPAYGDSHFYSASPSECAATAAAHPVDWVYESPSVFYVALPDATTGACPASTTPVYRYFNTLTTNHRYTTEIVVRNSLDASYGWVAEGYGPGPYLPVMCAVAS